MLMTNLLRVVIVEDQANIRKDLKAILERLPGIVIVAETGTVQEAKVVISATRPDLVLMDVMLTDGDCFEILASFTPLTFRIVFLTAFQQYAIQAIKYGALDYLLKPVDSAEMEEAIGRVLQAAPIDIVQLNVAARHFHNRSVSERIALPSNSFWQVVDIDNIVYAEGTNGTVFHLRDKRKVSTIKNLRDYEELLPTGRFLRVHQSYLIHHRYVDRYHKAGYIVLQNGVELPVSARRRQYVEEFLRHQ